jgi:hypothetical protein
MRRTIISLLLLAGLTSAPARAEELKLADNVPDRYVVVKGDTLWDISGRFLKQPWRWPEIWRLNKDEIKDPHWIYPGDVIVLDYSDGSPRLRLMKQHSSGGSGEVKLSPRIRSEASTGFAIPSIPPSVIEPYLSQPLVVGPDQLKNAPRVAQGPDDRVILSVGEKAYVVGIADNDPNLIWQIYRPGKALTDPDTKELLGYEAEYLGDAKLVSQQNKVTTMQILKVKQEITIGDRLVPAHRSEVFSYVPHAPATDFGGKVISAYGGVAEIGQYGIPVINRGARDGVEPGHVLALYKQGRPIKKESAKEETLFTPAEVNGYAFVFRVFDRVSYALIMNVRYPVNVMDEAHKP